MKKYVVKQKKTDFCEMTVEANNPEEAERKAFEGDFDWKKDYLKCEFCLPSSDWETVEVREVKK